MNLRLFGQDLSPCCDSEIKQVSSQSVMDNLTLRKLSLEKQLKDIDNALLALKQNPEVVRVLELLAKV